jgi:hypothetical protein
MKIKQLIFLFSIVAFLSCGSSKNATKGGTKLSAVKDIVSSHQSAQPNFNTLASRVQVLYEDEKKAQSITASLRMEKDKVIWIKASILGITLAKVLITPDQVSYYESISNTYFEGDFAFLSEMLGTEINFQKAQDILLGQSIFSLNPSDYKVDLVHNKYKFLPKTQSQNFIYSILLNADNFKVNSETLSQPNDQRLLTVRYGEYQEVGGKFYPSEIKISATEKESKTKIELNYKRIDLNVPISFPFNIPEGYEEIEFN